MFKMHWPKPDRSRMEKIMEKRRSRVHSDAVQEKKKTFCPKEKKDGKSIG